MVVYKSGLSDLIGHQQCRVEWDPCGIGRAAMRHAKTGGVKRLESEKKKKKKKTEINARLTAQQQKLQIGVLVLHENWRTNCKNRRQC